MMLLMRFKPHILLIVFSFIMIQSCTTGRPSSHPILMEEEDAIDIPARALNASPEAVTRVAGLSDSVTLSQNVQGPISGNQPWSITVASWNLLNFGNRKAGLPPANMARPNLLTRMATIISQYNVVVLQEVLNNGNSITNGLAPYLHNYTCVNISAAAGRAGRRENYAVCYVNDPNLIYGGAYDYLGNPYTAINGTAQTAQNIWMRPPAYVRFRYKKPDNSYFQFDVTTIHTKPQYSTGPRPPGTPVHAPKNASVRNELTSVEANLQTHYAKRIVIGDLNADCTYYQPRYRGVEFSTWNSVIGDGVKTNTAQSSSCAYDRILLNNTIMPEYQNSGVYRLGINMRLDGRRVSDHYLVWARFGGVVKKKKRLVIATSVRGGIKKQRRYNLRKKIYITGSGIPRPIAGKTPRLYILRYRKTRNFDSFNDYSLTDVRGAPSDIQITAAGGFQQEVEWTPQAADLYNTVIDMNGDGVFRTSDGDIANNNNEADLLVIPSTTTHTQLASLDDNGNTRELFDADRAENVYASARSLPVSTDVNLYVIAHKLLPSSFTTWAQMKSLGTLQLASAAVPVLLRGDNIIRKQGIWTTSTSVGTAAVATQALYQTITTDVDGGLFASAWSTPALLFNGAAYTSTPQSYDVPASVVLPEVPPNAEWDMCDDTIITQYPEIAQACRATTPKNSAGGLAANVTGATFPGYFGTTYNLVLDVNQNGRFDAPDLVDTYDIGDMTTFFAAGNTTLSPANDGAIAIGEYKEFLNAHMNLNAKLDTSNTYTLGTSDASYHYNCSAVLPKNFFENHLTPSAQTGFRIQNNEIYVNEVNSKNAYEYSTNVYYHDVEADVGQTCWSASDTAYYDGFEVTNNSTVTVIADTHIVTNTLTAEQGTSICLEAEVSVVLSATTAGATGGALFGGPLGAAIGGGIGFIVGAVETHIAAPKC